MQRFQNLSRGFCVVAGAAIGFAAARPASAAFTPVDTFEAPGYTVGGSVNGINGWTVSAGTGRAAFDPINGANHVLEISGTSASLFHGLTLNNAGVGTLFYRFRTTDPVSTTVGTDLSIGMSDDAAPTAFTSFEAQATFINSDLGVLFPGQIRARDAGVFDLADNFGGSTWYNVWYVIDNPNDLFQVYVQGGAFASQTLLDGADGETWFSFRNTAGDGLNGNSSPVSNDLVSLFLRGGNPHGGPSWMDDIYFDASGIDLANPAPEPSVFALAGLGLAAWVKFRSTRRKSNSPRSASMERFF